MKKIFFITLLTCTCVTVFSQTRIAAVKTVDEILNEQYCSGVFKTADATYFDLLENNINRSSAMGYMNILDWLQGRVAGLQIERGTGFTRTPYIRNQKAAVYIDEIPVSDDFLGTLSIADIAMIKVIKNAQAISGWRGAGGVIAIYTIRGESTE